MHGCKGDVKGRGGNICKGARRVATCVFCLQDEATPQALKRKVVSPGDKSRPFGIEKELEAEWGESERG